MPMPPPLRVTNPHMVTQHVPDDTRLLPIGERLGSGPPLQRIELLIFDRAATVRPSEHLVDQLPEFPFTHGFTV